MRVFRNKDEQVVRRAGIDPAGKGPIRCPSCRAWLPSTATSCGYCDSVDPPRRKPDVMRAPTGSETYEEAAFGSEFDRYLRGIPGG